MKYLLWDVINRKNMCNQVLIGNFLWRISKGIPGFHSMTLRMALLRFSQDLEVERMNKIWINKIAYRYFTGALSELPEDSES